MKIARTPKEVTISLPIKQAEILGVVLECFDDTLGCIEAGELGITGAQLKKADENFYKLLEALQPIKTIAP